MDENENIEIDLLLEGIYQKYGYDFRSYSKASLRRRIRKRLAASEFDSISAMQHAVLYNPSFFDALLLDLSINVTEMFRDPSFYLALRQKVIPELKGFPFIKIWHAGCATGEEIYSMAILLEEAGLRDRVQIYATDFNEVVLTKAREGIFPLRSMRSYTRNYQEAGGTESFSKYYTARYDSAIIDPSLRKKIIFADHNLVTDGVFGEMHLIFCRNVLIYFNQALQSRVLNLFQDSLCEEGILCLGSRESLRFSQCSEAFEDLAKKEKIYRKKIENPPPFTPELGGENALHGDL